MRKVLSLLLLAVIFIAIGTAQTPAYEKITANGQTFYKYKVKPGEGLYAVSRTFNVAVNDILKYNPKAGSGLQSGQELLIPVPENSNASAPVTQAKQQSPLDQNRVFRHTIARGETLYGIAQMYNTTVDEIARYNSGLTENITEGQVIVIPQQRTLSSTHENYRYHTILPKETLYSVSRTYSLKPEDLIAANTGLSVETFQIGKTIRIPFFQTQADFIPYEEQTQNVTHKVKRGETLYSISQAYDVSVESIEKANPMLASGLKTNMELAVPVKVTRLDENARTREIEANRLLSQSNEIQKAGVIRVGLLLPFLDKSGGQHLRLQEYYEGFLLAVDKMKKEGANIEVYVFEIGNKAKLESLLGTMEMEALHLLIGGMTDDQIRVLSDFSKKHNIKYIIPFSSKNSEVQNNNNVFQVNSPQSYLYSKVSGVFTETFRKANVVIVNVPGRSDKAEFISTLKDDLKRRNIRYNEVSLASNLSTDILPLLQSNGENVIVPSTGDSGSLREITGALEKVHQERQEIVTRLFGYPEWQTYNDEIKRSFHQYGTYFYTSFYVDDQDFETRQFVESFKQWYGRDLINTFPKYGMLGYDTGIFFLNAVYRFGTNFEQRIDRVPTSSLQFAFKFDRVNNWGGFINTGLYLIHYDTDNVVYKINKSR
ncbi:MAG TPA: LysM peptidoglycan-binding domain-containing protein [Petrimonas sp.]|uniref:LysM peptidoglycan-binding domain-containing protein n=1 Tax=Petrimonas sp. TaxID=2023866 RepID=UPI001754BA30|nr:LysM peptidoglycan-binding domain-containing protein [Petrimonas sp.]MEA4980990.1 LysM peptidoglycan-binding domain-containing protein [Petrimonas sp.]MEA5044541.1 LysM peptidoglycan-binding domain-containing protein [Petrimonas sp.]MEA5062019.1 LysM peptidoglycan-binding domain-containing protein [Petrimonas sp.]HHV85582.1 LysM peptidoglycan-binding domain-containing protein [Petrimonas sp.]